MSEMVTTDPAQLAELREQVETFKSLFSTLAQREADRPKKGKVREDLNNLIQSDIPIIVLSTEKYTNKKGTINEASLRSQFKSTAKDMELDFEPTLVTYEDTLYLVNLDAENAEKKFNEYVLRTAGIDTKELYALSADLDNATK